MLFKNATIYTFTALPVLTDEALEKLAFAPCDKHEPARFGFIKPRGFDALIGTSSDGDFSLVCLQKEEKILPSSVISLAVDKKVAEIKRGEDRMPGRRERLQFKEEAIFDLLPVAFSKYRRTNAIIDHKNRLLIVDGNGARADELTTMLREALGSLPVKPISTNASPANAMTDWLTNGLPIGFSTGDYCKLEETISGGAIHTCRNEDLKGEQVNTHINAGLQVNELSLTHEPLHFVLTHSLAMKSIRFTDLALDEAANFADGDEQSLARANLLLMGNGFASVVAALVSALDGQYEQ